MDGEIQTAILSLFVKILGTLLFLPMLAAALVAQSRPADTPNPPQAPSSEFSHARHLLDQGKYDDAIAELQQLSTSLNPKGVAHELGMAYYKKGDYFHAADSFKQALQRDSQDSESTQMLGISYYLSGNPTAAIPYLEKVQT